MPSPRAPARAARRVSVNCFRVLWGTRGSGFSLPLARSHADTHAHSHAVATRRHRRILEAAEGTAGTGTNSRDACVGRAACATGSRHAVGWLQAFPSSRVSVGASCCDRTLLRLGRRRVPRGCPRTTCVRRAAGQASQQRRVGSSCCRVRACVRVCASTECPSAAVCFIAISEARWQCLIARWRLAARIWWSSARRWRDTMLTTKCGAQQRKRSRVR